MSKVFKNIFIWQSYLGLWEIILCSNTQNVFLEILVFFFKSMVMKQNKKYYFIIYLKGSCLMLNIIWGQIWKILSKAAFVHKSYNQYSQNEVRTNKDERYSSFATKSMKIFLQDNWMWGIAALSKHLKNKND